MINLLFIPLMACLARGAGGGLGAHHLDKIKATWLPEALFAMCMAYPLAASGKPITILVAATIWSYIWTQTGLRQIHRTHFGATPHAFEPDRLNTLDKAIYPVFRTLKLTPGGVLYCYMHHGLKGLLIGLPLGYFAAILAILWPVSYHLGFRVTKNSVLAEWLSGASAGLVVVLCVF